MRNRSRIYDLIQVELRRRLSFDFAFAANLSDPESNSFRRGDLVRFKVWVRNGADIPFRRVSGFLSDTRTTAFRTTRFAVENLEPWREKEIATLDVLMRLDPRNREAYDWIANLTVVATADLSQVEIRESQRPLGLDPSWNETADRHHPRSIPVSAAPSTFE